VENTEFHMPTLRRQTDHNNIRTTVLLEASNCLSIC